jgi:hypothetical protein
LAAQVEQAEAAQAAFAKAKQQLAGQVEEARRGADEEARAKSSLAQQLRHLGVELEETRAQLGEEHEQRWVCLWVWAKKTCVFIFYVCSSN